MLTKHIALVLPFALTACSCGDGTAPGTASSSGGGAASTSGANSTSAGGSTTTSAGPSSTGATSASSTSSGAGAADAVWTPVPWSDDCVLEYAQVPSAAFPPLEWEACPNGPPSCERVREVLPSFALGASGIIAARRAGSGQELSYLAGLATNEARVLVIASDGVTSAAYRIDYGNLANANCGAINARLGETAHWVGVKRAGTGISTIVRQPSGAPPTEALRIPIDEVTQRQEANESLYAVELDFASGIKIYDHATGDTHETGLLNDAEDPRLGPDAVFFVRIDTTDDPTAWVWDRKTTEFRLLLDGGSNVIGDVRGDGEVLLWVENTVDPKRLQFGTATVYTSPYTLDAKAIVPAARWSDIPVHPYSPKAMGAGYWVGAGDDRQLYVLRTSDGRRWTFRAPDEGEGASDFVDSIRYIDEDVVLFTTRSYSYRVQLAALGEGMPAE